MTLAKGPDPVTPILTFDNYIIPDTVKEVRTPRKRAPSASPVGSFFSHVPRQAATPIKVPTGLVVCGTFLLGVLTAWYFVTPPQPTPLVEIPAAALQDEPVAEMATLEQSEDPASAVTSVPETSQEPASAGPAALERVVATSLQQDVTRQQSADLITPAGAASSGQLGPLSLAEILLGLTPQRSTIEQSAGAQDNGYLNRDILETLRESVLSGTYTVKTVQRNGVERLCLRTPHADVSQDQAADLLRDAAERGEIDLPDALSTADGDFDADTLIFNLVQTSLANDGTEAGAQAAREMSRRAFVASNATTNKVNGERVYVVQPGDSLAYLSLQFYGQPSAYPKIYEANRRILRSPDYIQVGQRLIIPG